MFEVNDTAPFSIHARTRGHKIQRTSCLHNNFNTYLFKRSIDSIATSK